MLVCQRQMQKRVLMQPLPFVWLSRGLGARAAICSSRCAWLRRRCPPLCAMLCAMTNLLPRFLARYARS